MDMSEFVKFLILSNPLELCSVHFPTFRGKGTSINKDPTVWPDRARPLPEYAFKTNMSLKSSKIKPMEQHALKTVNTSLNTNIYSYLETSGGQSYNLYLNVLHFLTPVLIRHLWQLKLLFSCIGVWYVLFHSDVML